MEEFKNTNTYVSDDNNDNPFLNTSESTADITDTADVNDTDTYEEDEETRQERIKAFSDKVTQSFMKERELSEKEEKERLTNRKKTKTDSSMNSTVKNHIRTARFFIISGIFIFFVLSIAVIMCNYITNRNFKESFYTVSNIKIDNKIRIIQISDLHSVSFGENNADLLNRVKKLKPDIILCTGDIIDSTTGNIEDTVKLCAELAKIAPSYYVYGNNEAETVYGYALTKTELENRFGKDADKTLLFETTADSFEEKLELAGMTVLKNQTASLTVGTTKVDIYGVLTSNPSAFYEYAGESYSNFLYTEPDNLKITAIHEPILFEEFTSGMWGDFIACGHTHGGYIRVPVLGPLYTREGGLFPERNDSYVYGRYDTSGTPMVVSAGFDNNTLLRINNQPELVIIDINKF